MLVCMLVLVLMLMLVLFLLSMLLGLVMTAGLCTGHDGAGSHSVHAPVHKVPGLSPAAHLPGRLSLAGASGRRRCSRGWALCPGLPTQGAPAARALCCQPYVDLQNCSRTKHPLASFPAKACWCPHFGAHTVLASVCRARRRTAGPSVCMWLWWSCTTLMLRAMISSTTYWSDDLPQACLQARTSALPASFSCWLALFNRLHAQRAEGLKAEPVIRLACTRNLHAVP